MKELTVEQKAKAYDKLVKKLRHLIAQDVDPLITKDDVQVFPPEFKESNGEDDEIKRAIIEHLRDNNLTEWASWLEKRCEEKYTLKSFKDEDVRKFMQYIEKQAKAYDFNLPNRSYDIYAFTKDILVWLEKQSEQKNPYREISFKYNNHVWSICAKDNGIDILMDNDLKAFISLEKSFVYPVYPQPVLAHKSALEAIKEEKVDKQYCVKSADKVEPKFKVGNWYQCTKDFFGKGVTFDKNTAYYCAKEGCLQNEYGCHIAIVKDLFDNFKLWTIQDAKDGDILICDINKAEIGGDVEKLPNIVPTIFKFKNVITSRGYIHSYCHLYDRRFLGLQSTMYYNSFVYNIHPANKEQRDTLEKAMADAGYTFDFEKKEVKKLPDSYCQENCKGFQETGKCFADCDCEAKREAESIDKVEPKFKNGAWITDGYLHCKISDVLDDRYIVDTKFAKRSAIPFEREHNYHLWSIQDVKEGDVLVEDKIPSHPSPFIAIFRTKDSLDTFSSHCFIGFDGNFYRGETGHCIENLHPATKEQCDTLMKTMADAGYTFDFEKKALKQVEQNPAENKGMNLVEEDKRKINRIYSILGQAADTHAFSTSCRLIGDKECIELQDFLKSLISCETNCTTMYKPSEKQMKALEYYMHTLLATEHKEVLFGLYNDLKKLIE